MSTLKAQACTEVYQRGVDETVRTVARSGTPVDPHGLVYERVLTLADGTQLDMCATFEAGMNHAYVNHTVHGRVYDAYRYGSYVHIFHRGRWLDELEEVSAGLPNDPVVEAGRSRRQAEQAQQDFRFQPVD